MMGDFFHKLSTDESTQHALCPWCKFNIAKATESQYEHEPLAVMETIKPVFKTCQGKIY